MVVAIGKIVANGIIFDVKNWQTNLMNINNLLDDVDDLFNTLEQVNINYLLVGGVAIFKLY
ncbi:MULTISPECIES: hypothetical protein [unclassified Okeania]|uniref:hypothetical protein n=1 Tax=unclassified Okeania TaxID=2634635 RepID=UPI0013BAAB0A|nr:MULTISPECIES: hypothetical protein [unclassified Okeania]NEQ40501.1 hypothetical protein [Okeania sp. SIO3I5]GGA02186.1 hypothetical protein CYANOKiyG1_14170 [Okeania sp. KiyG1]